MLYTRYGDQISCLLVRALCVLIAVLAAGGILAFPAISHAELDPALEADVKLGSKAAEEVAKHYKLIDDPELLERVEAIGKAITEVAKVKEVPASYGTSAPPNFEYSFKVIEDNAVNAFALPGGFVYVNQGLLDFVHSDDELAAVMAHEVAHVAHRHAIQLMKEQEKRMLGMAAAAVLIGAILGSKSDDASVLVWATEVINIAKMSAYGREAEFDADRTAVAYLAKTEYNPVGMLTLIERLEQSERLKPQVNPGIFATHPPTHLRAREIIDELEKRDIPINRRLVTNYVRVEAKPVEDSSTYSVSIGDVEIMRLADTNDAKSSDRAEQIAKDLSGLLLAGAGFRDVKLSKDGRHVLVMDEVAITPTPEDAELLGESISEVTKSAADAIRRALINERLRQGC